MTRAGVLPPQSHGQMRGTGAGEAVRLMRRGDPQDGDFPWWLVAVAGIGLYLFWRVLSDGTYAQVLATLSKGIGVTIFVTLVAFTLAALIGLLLAVASLSRFVLLRQAARLYIEVVRGVPILVLLLYVAFVLAPAMVAGANSGRLRASGRIARTS